MNAAIKAVVRSAIYYNLKVTGIMKGYSGLLNSDYRKMESHSVSKIISNGGTILKSSRCPEFKQKKAKLRAYKNMTESQW